MAQQDLAELSKQFNDQFARLYAYMDKRFDAIDERFDKTDQKFSQLQSTVDGFAGDVVDTKLEQSALIQKVDRHEKWIQRAAPKIHIKYNPETSI